MLFTYTQNTLEALKQVILQLNNRQFCHPNSNLSQASIGEHTRHIIELFQCLVHSYENGTVNYDLRERNIAIQTDVHRAVSEISILMENLEKPNKELTLQDVNFGGSLGIPSNYFREILYNLEHCIHHQALIKVGLLEYEAITIPETFGIAPSTLNYRKACVQ